MKKYILVLLVPLLFLMAQCKKEDPPHVNKFTCKVNGVFWESVPRERSIFGNDLRASKYSFNEWASIQAWNEKMKQSLNFNFRISDTLRTSIITVENPFNNSMNSQCDNYKLDTNSIRQVLIIEHDKEKRIVKGTFQLTAIPKIGNCSNLVISDGFFDMQYSID
jgi:hypothetical protein